jgi:hypothetical protein
MNRKPTCARTTRRAGAGPWEEASGQARWAAEVERTEYARATHPGWVAAPRT